MGYHTNKSVNESSMQKISSLLQEVEKPSGLKRLQCVYLREKGSSVEEISAVTQHRSYEHAFDIPALCINFS